MINYFYILFVAVAGTTLAFGAENVGKESAKVLRLKVDASNSTWTLKVNNEEISGLSNTELTNRVRTLGLAHGDLLILGCRPDRESAAFGKVWKWLSAHCEAKRVAPFEFGATNAFSIPIYHSVTPFDDPGSLGKASFFCDGVFLGAGKEGADATLRVIERSRPPRILILNSLYDYSRSFPTAATPYERLPEFFDSLVMIGIKCDVLSRTFF